MKKLIAKKGISFVLALLVITSTVLSGCKGSDGGGSGADDNKITWMSMLHTDSPPADDVVAKLGELTGAEISFQWIPDASKDEKLNTALASRSLADIVSLTQVATNAAIRTAIQDGLFWDVEPFLADYPNLASISAERIDAARVDGKLYGVPFQKPVARYGVLIRQDWLDNLGLEVPHTVEDLLEVAKAFTENDPDGNGQKDTVGLVERSESFNIGFRMLAGYYGSPNYFSIDENGKVNCYFLDDSFYKAAEDMRYLFENGYMNSDWVVMPKNDQKDYLVRGKGGIIFSGLFEAKSLVTSAIETGQGGSMTPGDPWTLINDITVEGVDRRILSDTNGGFGGLLAMPKSEVKDEAELRKILSFIDKLNSKEAFIFMTYGVEGVHHEVTEDGAYKYLDESKWKQEVQALSSSRPNEMWTYEIKADNPLTVVANEMIVENEQYAVFNECQALNSDTYTKDWNQILKIVQDSYANYVMGKSDMDTLRSEVDRWLASGGQKIIDEYEADYARLHS